MIYAIANQKGGVAKTTTTVNLGSALAERGKRVLLVDFDPQCSLTIALGTHPYDVDAGIYQALMQVPAEGLIDQLTLPVEGVPGLSFVPATQDLAQAENDLIGELGREYFLKNALVSSDAVYDYILIDCPPSLSLLTTNALAAR